MNIAKEYFPHYANLFNRSQIIDFINKIDAKYTKNLLKESNLKMDGISEISYLELYEQIYTFLKKEYRCEYIYLNEIFLNEILKSHEENSSIITELTIGTSKVDLLLVNGTTTAYEIKTELDSLVRLEKQLFDYMKAFDKIYVVTYSEFVNKVDEFLKKDEQLNKVGIKVLDSNGNLNCIKKSKSFIKYYNKEIIFNCLIKSEREIFDKSYYIAKKKFLKHSNKYIHNFFKECLIKRKKQLDFINNLPESLKMVGYKIQNTLNKSQKEKFYIKLNNKIKI